MNKLTHRVHVGQHFEMGVLLRYAREILETLGNLQNVSTLLNRAFSNAFHSLAAVKTCTVRWLTHVLCKPTQFFFHSFIATMPYSLQTSFYSVMKDWADKYHAWGTLHEVTFKVKLPIISSDICIPYVCGI